MTPKFAAYSKGMKRKLVIAVSSTFLGLSIAVSVSEVFEAQTFSNFFRFPMVFLWPLLNNPVERVHDRVCRDPS